MLAISDGMDANELPKEVETLRSQLANSQLQVAALSSTGTTLNTQVKAINTTVTELSSTVTEQHAKLERKERQLQALLKSLKGKQCERLDPNQLSLFDLGNLV